MTKARHFHPTQLNFCINLTLKSIMSNLYPSLRKKIKRTLNGSELAKVSSIKTIAHKNTSFKNRPTHTTCAN